jgi:hypothetical protein
MIYLQSLKRSVVMAKVSTKSTQAALGYEFSTVPLYGGAVLLHLSCKFSRPVLIYTRTSGCPSLFGAIFITLLFVQVYTILGAAISAPSCESVFIPNLRVKILIIQRLYYTALRTCSFFWYFHFHSPIKKVKRVCYRHTLPYASQVIKLRSHTLWPLIRRLVSFVTLGSFPSKLYMLPCSSDYITVLFGPQVLRKHCFLLPPRDSRYTFLFNYTGSARYCPLMEVHRILLVFQLPFLAKAARYFQQRHSVSCVALASFPCKL